MRTKRKVSGKSYVPVSGKKSFRKQVPFLVMLVFPMLYFAVFKYLPMFGLAMAFQNYKTGAPFIGFDAQWVGLQWFRQLFQNPFFGRLVRNTLLLSIYYLTCSFPFSIFLALLLNEVKNGKFKKVSQTITYLPHFISLVVACGMIKDFCLSTGLINDIIAFLGGERSPLLQDPKYFRTIYTVSSIWQEVGWGSIRDG